MKKIVKKQIFEFQSSEIKKTQQSKLKGGDDDFIIEDFLDL